SDSAAQDDNVHGTRTVRPRSPRPPQSAMWTPCNIRHNTDGRSRMLTVDFDRLAVLPGHRLIDIGAGAGRHSFEAYRRGAAVTALDQNVDDLAEVEHMFSAMAEAGEVAPGGSATTVRGDAL